MNAEMADVGWRLSLSFLVCQNVHTVRHLEIQCDSKKIDDVAICLVPVPYGRPLPYGNRISSKRILSG